MPQRVYLFPKLFPDAVGLTKVWAHAQAHALRGFLVMCNPLHPSTAVRTSVPLN